MQMNKKNPNLSRADKVLACERAILTIFEGERITISEAIFIFEKIKFAALYGESQKFQSKAPVVSDSASMFR